jgi:hypothetical protein
MTGNHQVSARIVRHCARALSGLSLMITLAGTVLVVREYVVTGTTLHGYWLGHLIDAIIYGATGWLITTRRPAHPIGWLFAVAGLLSAFIFTSTEYAAAAFALGAGQWPGGPIAAWSASIVQTFWQALWLFLLLLFPTGRLPSSRTRVLARVIVIGAALDALEAALQPGQLSFFPRYTNPFALGAAIVAPLTVASGALILIATIGVLTTQLLRLRSSREVERQQLKWFFALPLISLAMVAGLALPGVIGLAPSLLSGIVVPVIWECLNISVPVAAVFAVLRYHLYDIDRIVNRALVYGALTAALALIYFGSVAIFQRALRTVGGLQDTPITVMASTAAVAVLFQPLRLHLQEVIDRLFYRRKYDAAQMLASFGSMLRDDTELDEVTMHLMCAVKDTIHPIHVSLWLRPPRSAKLDA